MPSTFFPNSPGNSNNQPLSCPPGFFTAVDPISRQKVCTNLSEIALRRLSINLGTGPAARHAWAIGLAQGNTINQGGLQTYRGPLGGTPPSGGGGTGHPHPGNSGGTHQPPIPNPNNGGGGSSGSGSSGGSSSGSGSGTVNPADPLYTLFGQLFGPQTSTVPAANPTDGGAFLVSNYPAGPVESSGGGGSSSILLILLLVGGAGAAYYYYQKNKG